MNKGFSLIEIIVYIGLLSSLIMGVFYSVAGTTLRQINKKDFLENDYKLLIKNLHE